MRYDHFSLLPERAFQPRGRFGMTFEGGGGGGQPTQSTVTQTNIPEYARPYVESMLGATMQQLFTTRPTSQTTTPATYDAEGNMISPATTTPAGMEITGFKPYVPYSEDPSAYVAGFSPMQREVFGEAGGMKTPEQFGTASGMAEAASMRGMESAETGLGYGGLGAGYGTQGANIGLNALGYGRAAADIGGMGVGAARQGFGAGQQYAAQATSPQAMQSYMSPYMQNVVDVQKQQAIRDYQEQMPQLQAQAVRAGAYGGSRDAVQRAMAQRSLNQQLQNIQAQGTQQAFQQAQQAQQFGAGLGLQGLQAGLQGLQTGIAGQQAGMQGIQGALAGTAQGMQGAGLGLQGVGAAQTGYGLAGQQAANLANIGAQQQQADLARLGFQGQIGGQQQAQQQAIINQAIQNYATAQQYPQQQLAFMNAMLRGLPMQAMTTQSYQAQPSTINQLAGAGSTIYGLGKMGGAWKKGGEVKKFAGGGITDISKEVLLNPEKFSEASIKRLIAEKVIDETVGLPALRTIELEKQRMQNAQAMSAPQQPTVKNQILGAAPQGMGIDQANINPDMFAGAGGGIVAFNGEEGSNVSLSDIVKSQQEADPFYEGDTEEIPGIDTKTLRGLERHYLKQLKSLPEGELTKKYKEYYSPEAMKSRAEKQKAMDEGLFWAKFGAALGSTPSTRGGLSGLLQGASQAGTKTLPEMEAAIKGQRAAEEAGLKIGADIEAKERAEQVGALGKAEAVAAKIAERKAAAALKTTNIDRYVKYMTDASVIKGDKRPREVIEADHAEQFQKYQYDPRMIQAGASAQQAGVAGTRATTDIETAITTMEDKVNKEYKTQILMAETPAERARLEQERDNKIARRAAEIRRGNAPAPAPTAATPAAAPTLLPLPAKKDDLQTGKVYSTARGPAKWDGSQFTPVQ